MNQPSPFKPNTTVFHLREDFADQVCPSQFCGGPNATIGGLIFVPMDDYLTVGVGNFAFGRYYFYGACSLKDTRRMDWFIWDGVLLMPVESEGLFAEMLATAKKVYGESVEKMLSPQIPLSSTPFEKYEFGSHVLVHDTRTCMVAPVSLEEARSFLRKSSHPEHKSTGNKTI